MKDLIVGSVIIVLLLSFVLQGIIDTSNAARIEIFEDIVYTYAEKARIEGYFTPEIINDMLADIDNIRGIDASEITYTLTTVPRYRTIDHYDERELIEFSVTILINNAFAGGVIFNQSEPVPYTCSGSVTSERLP